MDRRNGGDSLAPPRPPKLQPRIHRPRAPEPTMSQSITTTPGRVVQLIENSPTPSRTHQQSQTQTQATPSNSNNNLCQQQSQEENSISNNHSSNIIHNFNGSSNNNVGIVADGDSVFDDYQIHHLTYLPQRPSSLSRNSSHVSTSSASSSITAASTFTRRRPPPPTPGSVMPLLAISGSNNSNSNSNNNNLSGISSNFLSHFQSNEQATSPTVTLAQPRPESERLANEYVDTPLRSAQQLQQLQHTSRAQHPAGQHDSGQTTTHHLLLLPQRSTRHNLQQHQQAPQQQLRQQHSSRLAGTAGSANATTGTDRTDGLLHSHMHTHTHKSPSTTCPHTGKDAIQTLPCGFATPGLQPITQPITKQPASTTTNNTCKFAKDSPALDELLDMHNIATSISTAQGIVSTVNGASPLGTPIIISGDPTSMQPITCPRCERCRCEQCQGPRPLPQTWVCNKTCLCSAESVIDYASCLCCAKALFYHCAPDNDMDCDDGSGTPCVDNPCSCGPYKRTQRWGWLGALSLVLPCLWCYWPMRGCVALCEKCYGKYAGRGCRCQQIGSTSSMLPIVALGNGDSNSFMDNNSGGPNSGAGDQLTAKTLSDHHKECSTASRILRKGDLTPEKRLLDSSPEY